MSVGREVSFSSGLATSPPGSEEDTWAEDIEDSPYKCEGHSRLRQGNA